MLGSLLLLTTALIWGCAFLAQKLGMDHVGPFTFTVARNALAVPFLLGVIAVRNRLNGTRRPLRACFGRTEWIGGFWCGFVLFIASMFQQIGIQYTTPGICAFLTTNYVLAVPLLGLFAGRIPHWSVWPGVAFALVGTYLICMTGSVPMGKGEMLTLACAICFGGQILVVDRFVAKADILALSCVQFLTGVVLGLPFLLLPSERALLSLSSVWSAAGAIAFCGILSSGVAYTLQNVAQGRVPPALAAIIMSLESVFGVLAGWIFLGDVLTARQLVGCGLVLSAVVFTELCNIKAAASPQANAD